MKKVFKKDKINQPLTYLVAVFFIVLVAYFSESKDYTGLNLVKAKKDKTEDIFNKNSFSNISIKGQAYIIYDILTGEIISSKNENDVLPLASLSKVMLAYTSLSHFDKNTIIDIGSVKGGYDLGLKRDQKWPLSELLKYTLTFSSNDGAEKIADNLGGRENFLILMNNDAKALGLNLFFNDPAGLDEGEKLGGSGSAKDVAMLFSSVRRKYPYILDSTTHLRISPTSYDGKVIGVPNTNQRVSSLSGVEGSKTGFTDKAGGNLAVVVDVTVGRPVVIVVLGSTYEERFNDVETLYKALKESIK